MLTLSDEARDAVQDLARRAGLPREGGLRLAGSPARDAVDLVLVTAPVQGDDVIEADGARVFVDPAASSALADQRLHASTSAEGTGFSLEPQG